MALFILSVTRTALFVLMYVWILFASFLAVKSAGIILHPNLTWAVLFDAVILPMVAFYYIIARRWVISNFVLVAVWALFLRIGLFIIPLKSNYWTVLVAATEFGLIASVLYRLRSITKSYKQFRTSEDSPAALKSAISSNLGQKTAAIIFSELQLLRYGLFGWILKNDIVLPRKVITNHRKSAIVPLTIAILLVGVMEAGVVHILLAKWSETVAFWVTGVSLYGLLFLLADMFASLKRPSFADSSTFSIRQGIRWALNTRWVEIENIDITTKAPEKSPDSLNATFLTTPNILITFKKPTTVDGPYGMERKITRLALFVDTPNELIKIHRENACS